MGYKEYEVLTLGTELRKLLEKKSEPLMKKYGLRKIELDILADLSSGGCGDTAKEIIERKHISKAHVSKSIDNLKTHGLITITEDCKDHRYMHILLSEKAKDVVEDFMEIHKECTNIVFRGITQEEKTAISKICQKMQENIQKELDNA